MAVLYAFSGNIALLHNFLELTDDNSTLSPKISQFPRLAKIGLMNIDIQLLLVALPILVLSIAFHEMMHAFVSNALGDDTARHQGRITLNPLAHIDPLMTIGLPLFLILIGLPPFGAARPVPFNPSRIRHGEWGVALVALSGPLTNLVLAILAGVIYRLIPTTGFWLDVSILMMSINVGFFVFNMIPFPPLDGSRVLYALAPDPVKTVMERIEASGIAGLFVFMFLVFPFIRPVFDMVGNFLLSVLT